MITLADLPERPRVSVVMPSYNQAAYIRESILSVLRQNYRPIEIIIQDGVSTDGTMDILREFDKVPEVSSISEPDEDVCDAVNKGLGRATGDIIAIQSTDDLYASDEVIGDVVRNFIARPDVGLLYGNMVKEDQDGNILFRSSFVPFSLEAFLLGQTRIPQEAAFFRREAAEATGGWRREVSYAADTDFFLRMCFKTKAHHLHDVYGRRIMHSGQRYEQHEKIIRCYERMIRDCLELWRGDDRTRRLAEISILLNKIKYSQSRRVKFLAAIQISRLRGNDIHVYRPPLAFLPGYWTWMRLYNLICREFRKNS